MDARANSIILPIYGLAVPFHISTLKNVSKSDEGDYVMLRLNFITPGQAGGKKEDQVRTIHLVRVYAREIVLTTLTSRLMMRMPTLFEP